MLVVGEREQGERHGVGARARRRATRATQCALEEFAERLQGELYSPH